jgi:hypothetical protein
LVPIYSFMVYAPEDLGEIPLAPHPTHPTVVLSCDDPPVEDEIVDFGRIGIGQTGYNPCPDGPTPLGESTWGRIKVLYR